MKAIKMFFKGIGYGVRHPFTTDTMEGTKDMSTVDALAGNFGFGLTQGAIQTTLGYGICILAVMAVGYVGSKINKPDIKVKMVVDK